MSLNSATLITLTSPLILPHKNLTQQLLFIIILIRLFFQSAVSLFFFSCSSQLLLLFNQLKTEILHSHIMEKTFVLIQELQTAAEKSFNLKKYFWKVCCPSIVYKMVYEPCLHNFGNSVSCIQLNDSHFCILQ